MEPLEDLASLWSRVEERLERELGGVCEPPRLLSSPWSNRATWGVATSLGEMVVKVREGDRAAEKTEWCARNLPLLEARGSPVPSIVWHGLLDGGWHVAVQRRLPGRSLRSLTWPLLEEIIGLIELQADAEALPSEEDRDFAGYIANVLFDDWDDVWANASSGGPEAPALCGRLRRWLEPVWGLQLPPSDFTNNDLNLSNILSDGQQVTGIVDWDELGLGSRAIDLVVLAFDCVQLAAGDMANRLLARAAEIAGHDGLRCLVSYRAIATLANDVQEAYDSGNDIATIEGVLQRLAVG